MIHSNKSTSRNHFEDSNHTSKYRKNLLLTILVAISVSTVFFMPQHAFSTLTFTDYSNSTSTLGINNTSTSSTNNQTSNTSNTNSAVTTNSTNSSSTQSTNSTNQSTGSTNSTQSTNAGQTNQTSTTNSTQTTNGTSTTTTNSTNTNATTTSSSSSESSNPVIAPSTEGSGSGSSSSDITILTPTTSSSSSSSESAISPSIVISGVGNSVNQTAANSSATSSSTIYTGSPILPAGLALTDDQSYYAYGDVVTIKALLPGLGLQNIAIVVADPTGNDIVSRTVTTDVNGTAQLQFKIPSNFQTGNYTDIATALVDGKSYTNSTEFSVIKTHGILINSVQLIDQQGNPASMIKKGQNNFVKVSISSGETIPALLTLNLFDTNQSSIGTASIKSTINPGDTQMTLSFFIPPNAQVGSSDIFTDAYSDWPSNGGTPLTTESCLSASLEDPTTLPVSYQPIQPQTCTQHPQNLAGTTLVSTQNQMTNDQATVMLGVAVQNDSMTFMSPTQAQLLALAYKNGTATNVGDKSISLVSLNLNALNSTITQNTTSSGNVTQFTTLVGPALQNDPMAQKILQEIQISKQQVANIIGNETAAKINDELIQKQRVAAASQLKQDLTALAQANIANTPSAQYASFLATVPDNRTQQVFEGEFNFMQQRVSAANAAMQNVLDNGGSWDQAIQTFDSYAAVNHAQIVQINQNLNVEYGLADSNVQSCFDSNGDLTVVNGVNTCIANIENNSTNSSGIKIVSVQPTDQNGNTVSLFTRGQSGFVRVQLYSSYTAPTLVTINLFDSNLDTLGTSSAEYTLNPGNSEVVLPYYVPMQSSTGLASIYADTLTDWPNKGGTSESHELSYFVGIS
ncbi:MAG TPA: hypothetical protein VJR22_07590 [Candidatus Nitrosotalea sp.]|nr:hypothetical protein [Nitrososphaerota archaeon]HKU33691.1 hypothetical protein [Candidatus Nitrosotalea sp.]